MPKIVLQPWIKEIRGKMGDVVFKRSPTGELIMAKRPDMSKVKWSPAQKAYRKHFKKAIAYAHEAMADPKTKKHYERIAKKAGRQPFRVAVSDFLKGNDLLAKRADKAKAQ